MPNTAGSVILLKARSYYAILCSKPLSHVLSDLIFLMPSTPYLDQPFSAILTSLFFPEKPRHVDSLGPVHLLLPSVWEAISLSSTKYTVSFTLGHRSNVIFMRSSLTTLKNCNSCLGQCGSVCWSIILWTEGLQVQFLFRAHA